MLNLTLETISGPVVMDNNPMISIDELGLFVVMSWLDTDQEDILENISPDIYCAAYDLFYEEHWETANITTFTQAMWTSYFGSQSQYIFSEVLPSGAGMKYTVPFVYASFDSQSEIDYYYMGGLEFISEPWSAEETQANRNISVQQNQPNPFTSTTNIEFSLKVPSNITLEVWNTVGQKVSSTEKVVFNQGSHKLEIDGTKLNPGLFFYVLKTNSESYTGKMVRR
jgi:type IX secretion system substrate protein